MVESHFGEWLELALRWAHLAVGIAWIGASFYFNWLENRLQRGAQENSALEGDLWAIHGGGFYHIQKYEVAPDKLPTELHWFKWEAYFTWFTGLALLVLVFYLNARVYLLDASIYDLTPLLGTIIGVGSLIVSWIFYDRLCASPIKRRPRILAAIVFVFFSLLAFVLCQMFSGRGAYVHVGAAIGTIMVLNVMAVIIPSQKRAGQCDESWRHSGCRTWQSSVDALATQQLSDVTGAGHHDQQPLSVNIQRFMELACPNWTRNRWYPSTALFQCSPPCGTEVVVTIGSLNRSCWHRVLNCAEIKNGF